MWITRFVTYLSIAFHIYLPIIIHFQLIIIKNVSILTDFTYLVPPSCLWYSRFEVTWLLRDDSNSKTRVRFVYVLPEVLHSDFLSEIEYLFNLEGNILHILTRNFIFFYDYLTEVNSHSSFSCKKILDDMSINEILSVLGLTQSVHYKICIRMHRGKRYKIVKGQDLWPFNTDFGLLQLI